MVRHSLYEGGGETGPAGLYNKHDDDIYIYYVYVLCVLCVSVCTAEWEKLWSRLPAHLQPFFRFLAHILTIFDKKYRILTCRDKREFFLIVLKQNNVQVC